MSKATENSHSTDKKLYTGTVISAIAATASLVGTIGTAHADTVEVPLSTFNPVKTVNDLLRPEHQ